MQIKNFQTALKNGQRRSQFVADVAGEAAFTPRVFAQGLFVGGDGLGQHAHLIGMRVAGQGRQIAILARGHAPLPDGAGQLHQRRAQTVGEKNGRQRRGHKADADADKQRPDHAAAQFHALAGAAFQRVADMFARAQKQKPAALVLKMNAVRQFGPVGRQLLARIEAQPESGGQIGTVVEGAASVVLRAPGAFLGFDKHVHDGGNMPFDQIGAYPFGRKKTGQRRTDAYQQGQRHEGAHQTNANAAANHASSVSGRRR